MKNQRAKRLIFCCLFLAMLISTVAVLSCQAENYPDIGRIDSSLYLNGNRQFFHRLGSGYALLSTDLSSKTLASLLGSNGDIDYECNRRPIIIPFVYEKATVYKNFLFIAGRAPDAPDCVKVGRIDLSNGKYLMNQITCVNCDFSRGFSADANGKLSLVTVPVDSVIEPDTRASTYIFDSEQKNACIKPQPHSPVSSALSSSSSTNSGDIGSTDSDALSSISSSTSSHAIPSQPEENAPPLATFNFDGPVTVESLRKELDSNALGQNLRVFTADKKEVKSGNIGTGQMIETVLNGKTENRYIAVIPGDLDGTGIVTEDDCRILYEYFTEKSNSSFSVLSGPFFDAAKINDDEKIDDSRNELHPSDLLKIKKLIK